MTGLAATKPDVSPSFLQKVFRDPKTQTGSDLSLRAEEWCKDSRPILRRDSHTVIGNADSNSGTTGSIVARWTGANDNLAVLTTGIDSIRYQVGQYLF